MKVCPACEGNGEGGFAFVSRHDDSEETGISSGVEQIHCMTCIGTGEVPDSYFEEVAKTHGAIIRKIRVAARLSLNDAAKLCELPVTTLSRIERGLPIHQ